MVAPTLRAGAGLVVCLAVAPAALAQHLPPELERERAEYAAWLAAAPVSPLAALARQPVGRGVTLGPAGAEIPLDGVPELRITQSEGPVVLDGPDGRRALPRGVPVHVARHTFVADGPPGRAVVTVFGRQPGTARPAYFDYRPELVFVGALTPPARPGTVRVLGADGLEVEAAEAGTVRVPIAGAPVRLRVRRLPVGPDESDLEIFFRDPTNGSGSYPAGRFVSLVPVSPGRYRLDFNRARNPFCAYNPVLPCPAPWPGNAIPAPVPAGERYGGRQERG